MTRTTIARWTCNACQSVVETASDKQPEGWVGYAFTANGVPAGEHEVIGHLCAECHRSVKVAMDKRGDRG